MFDEDDYSDNIVIADRDLSEEPDNEYHLHDYDDVRDSDNVSLRSKEGLV